LAVAQQSAGQSELAERCWATYDRLWAYAWEHFVDNEHGAWWRILSADNRKLSAEKSPAGKVDYHTMGACHDVLAAMGHGAKQL
jgi:mannose/cellobiose epimerase-like protein (N-acyl-D-glucosamine 2-epimerase family)